jgi:D-sedoheptulose 7-phosphate isomerase
MSLVRYLDDVNDVMRRVDPKEVEGLVALLTDAYQKGRFVFLAGNGGSGSNASHLCEDLGKGTLVDFEKQKRLRVLSLTDNTPYILAWANDTSFDRVFVEQLKNIAEPGAILIAISGSGNSPNILKAVEYANAHGMTTVGMTGFDGGKLARLAHHRFHVPSSNMGVVEAVHAILFHYILDTLRDRFKTL